VRLTVTAFLTLDGIMQSPYAADEDPAGDFELGGWLPPHLDEPAGRYVDEILMRAGAFLLGRRTYNILAAYWPHTDAPKAGRSGVLAQSLMAEGLVDAYHLLVFPVVLGCGRRLFADGVPPVRLRLVDNRASGSGVVMLTYESAGGPVFGAVAAVPAPRESDP
jgi:dihydrofolate reductase